MDTISYSEIRTFERCKRLWTYTYEQGWAPKREDAVLTDGRWVHKLLAAYYAGASWHDSHAALLADALEACLFDEERDEVRRRADVIAGVMARYVQRYAEEAWEPIFYQDEPLIEREILVPLPTGGMLKAQVDLVARNRDDGTIWVWDHKTKREFDKDMEARLDFDPQLSIYTVGLRALGINVAGGLHNYLRMRLPAEPKINKDGTMSKVAVTTDEETVRDFIARSGAKISDDELAAYLDRLPKDAFFRRFTTIREQDELQATVRELEAKLRERELARLHGLNTRTLISDCMFCPFYRPCLADLKGGEEATILLELYRKQESAPTPEFAEQGGEA